MISPLNFKNLVPKTRFSKILELGQRSTKRFESEIDSSLRNVRLFFDVWCLVEGFVVWTKKLNFLLVAHSSDLHRIVCQLRQRRLLHDKLGLSASVLVEKSLIGSRKNQGVVRRQRHQQSGAEESRKWTVLLQKFQE